MLKGVTTWIVPKDVKPMRSTWDHYMRSFPMLNPFAESISIFFIPKKRENAKKLR